MVMYDTTVGRFSAFSKPSELLSILTCSLNNSILCRANVRYYIVDSFKSYRSLLNTQHLITPFCVVGHEVVSGIVLVLEAL